MNNSDGITCLYLFWLYCRGSKTWFVVMTTGFGWIKQNQTFPLFLWIVHAYDDFFNITPSISWFCRSVLYLQQQLSLLQMVYYFPNFWRRDLRQELIKCSSYLVFQILLLVYQECQWALAKNYLLKTLMLYAYFHLSWFF